MKKTRTLIFIAILCSFVNKLSAQEAISSASGKASGSGGESNYSVGQIVYTSITGSGGTVSQGVLQSFDISVVTGIAKTNISLRLSAFPNPTTNYLTLSIGEDVDSISKSSALNFQLYNMNGRLIREAPLANQLTKIEMETLPESTYFLMITENQVTIKTFKIVKN